MPTVDDAQATRPDVAHAPGPAPRPRRPGWHLDPLGAPHQMRWWDGRHWTAWVQGVRASAPQLQWTPVLATLGSSRSSTPPRAPRGRTKWLGLGIATVLVALLGVGAAGASTSLGSSAGPPAARTVAYSDRAAGFSLRYSTQWHVTRRTRGEGIRFRVDTPGRSAPATVSVVVDPEVTHLPGLSRLASEVTSQLRQRVQTIELVGAGRTRLAGRTAFRLQFVDPGATPASRIEQVVGLTVTGRPIVVTVTQIGSRIGGLAAFLTFLSTISLLPAG